MARYRVQGPDGKIHVFEGPDGASPADVEAFAAQTFGKKKPEAAPDPTQDMGAGERLLAGVGSGMTSAIRAVGGDRAATALGLPTKAEADQLDRPLLATTAGKVGQVLGVAAPAALAVPFTPATFVGAGLAGAGTGALLTEGDIGDRAQGAAMGGLGGLVGQALPIAFRTGKEALKGLAEPFTAAGRSRIAGRTIDRFAADKNALQGLTNAPTATGAQPTLAEAARDPGLATLERAIGTMDPEVAAQLSARGQANNAARVNALQGIAGDPAQRAAAEAARSDAAGQMYRAATAASYTVDDKLTGLLQRPVVRQAMQRAQALAENQGRPFSFEVVAPNAFSGMGVPTQTSRQITGQGLQDLKMALDEMLSDPAAGFAGKAGDAVRNLRGQIVDWMESANPDFRAARQSYAAASKPINAMDVGQRLLDKTAAAVRDMGGNRRLQANAFARALNDEQQLVRQATGFRGVNALDDVMTPDQMATLGAVRNELELVANLGNAANGPGSQTARMLASQNLLQRIAGPMGLPQSFAESVLARTAMRPVQFGMQAAEPRIQEAIARGLLDPEEALRMVGAARAADQVAPPNALQVLMRRSAPAAIGGLSAYGSRQ